MSISEIIQHHLLEIHSSVTMGTTIDGTYPASSAFAQINNRSVSVSPYKEQWGITFSAKEYCYARCQVSDALKLAQLIDRWLGRQINAVALKDKFSEIELFHEFEYVHGDRPEAVVQAWNKLKNFFFSHEYSSENLHFDINSRILEKAIKDPLLGTMYPFSSLGRICFSNKSVGFNHYLCIAANRWENRTEQYFINLPPDSRQIHLDSLEEGFNLIRENIHWLEQPE